MKTRLLLLPAAAVLALVVLGATGGRITTGEAWKGFQEQYLAQWRAKGGTGTPPPVEIKQDRLLGFGEDRIDRCRSCHVAVDDPLFVDGTQPLRTHPSIAPHAFNGMGCTICHEGDGRALTADLAHGKDRFWVEPMLTGQFIESSCARCHPAPYPAEAKHLQRGRALYQQLPCYGCHQVQGLSRGTLGIELTDVGLKRDVKFFKEKLTNPLFNVIATVMPKLNLTEQDKDDLATFLKSLKGRQLAEDPMSYRRRVKAFDNEKPAEVAISVEVGKHSVETRGCLSCHKLGSVDGQRAPDLSFEGQVRDASWIEAHLLDPRQHEPNSIMPNFWMSTSERKAIATFLTSLGGLQKPATPKEQYELLCTRCHGEKGGGDGVVAQSLLPRPRVFTNARFFNWLPEDAGLQRHPQRRARDGHADLREDPRRQGRGGALRLGAKELHRRRARADHAPQDPGRQPRRLLRRERPAGQGHLPRPVLRLPRPDRQRQGAERGRDAAPPAQPHQPRVLQAAA